MTFVFCLIILLSTLQQHQRHSTILWCRALGLVRSVTACTMRHCCKIRFYSKCVMEYEHHPTHSSCNLHYRMGVFQPCLYGSIIILLRCVFLGGLIGTITRIHWICYTVRRAIMLDATLYLRSCFGGDGNPIHQCDVLFHNDGHSISAQLSSVSSVSSFCVPPNTFGSLTRRAHSTSRAQSTK